MSHAANLSEAHTGGVSKQRILIIDDEPAFTRLVKLNLEKTGEFEVREQNIAQHAVRTAREFDPNLILLDIIMPGTDGGEVYTSLKADPKLKNIPVLYVTATLSRHETGEHGLASGGALYLGKPVTLETLLTCIKENLREAVSA